MRYHVALPLGADAGVDRRLDIIDPVTSQASRALAAKGLADFDVASNTVLLTLFDIYGEGFSLLDLGAGIGVASSMCASLFQPTRVVAYEPAATLAGMLRRVTRANGLPIRLCTDLSSVIDQAQQFDAQHVIRIGRTVNALEVLHEIVAASGNDLPPVVIVGERSDQLSSTELADAIATSGYQVFPLRRYPTWRPLALRSGPAHPEGWLLFEGPLPSGFVERHVAWAGAVGACTPDRNDREPYAAETRSSISARRGGRALLASVRLDLRHGAQRVWHRIDPWLPSPQSTAGRLIDRLSHLAQTWLGPPVGDTLDGI